MKKNLWLAVLLLVSLGGIYFYNKYRKPPVFDLFHSADFVDVNGKDNKSVEGLKGKKIILSFYASWCGDCLKEMKALNELKQNGKLDSNVVVVAITDESVQKFESFIGKKKYPFVFFRFTKRFDQLNVFSIPVNYLLNTKGEVVYEKVGSPDWEDPDWVRQALRMME